MPLYVVLMYMAVPELAVLAEMPLTRCNIMWLQPLVSKFVAFLCQLELLQCPVVLGTGQALSAHICRLHYLCG